MRKYLLSYWKDGEEYGRTIRALSWEEALHMVNLRNRGEINRRNNRRNMITAATARKTADEKNLELNESLLKELELLIKQASDSGKYSIQLDRPLGEDSELSDNTIDFLRNLGYRVNNYNQRYLASIRYTISWK